MSQTEQAARPESASEKDGQPQLHGADVQAEIDDGLRLEEPGGKLGDADEPVGNQLGRTPAEADSPANGTPSSANGSTKGDGPGTEGDRGVGAAGGVDPEVQQPPPGTQQDESPSEAFDRREAATVLESDNGGPSDAAGAVPDPEGAGVTREGAAPAGPEGGEGVHGYDGYGGSAADYRVGAAAVGGDGDGGDGDVPVAVAVDVAAAGGDGGYDEVGADASRLATAADGTRGGGDPNDDGTAGGTGDSGRPAAYSEADEGAAGPSVGDSLGPQDSREPGGDGNGDGDGPGGAGTAVSVVDETGSGAATAADGAAADADTEGGRDGAVGDAAGEDGAGVGGDGAAAEGKEPEPGDGGGGADNGRYSSEEAANVPGAGGRGSSSAVGAAGGYGEPGEPGASPDGASPDGASPDGASPDGASPNGASDQLTDTGAPTAAETGGFGPTAAELAGSPVDGDGDCGDATAASRDGDRFEGSAAGAGVDGAGGGGNGSAASGEPDGAAGPDVERPPSAVGPADDIYEETTRAGADGHGAAKAAAKAAGDEEGSMAAAGGGDVEAAPAEGLSEAAPVNDGAGYGGAEYDGAAGPRAAADTETDGRERESAPAGMAVVKEEEEGAATAPGRAGHWQRGMDEQDLPPPSPLPANNGDEAAVPGEAAGEAAADAGVAESEPEVARSEVGLEAEAGTPAAEALAAEAEESEGAGDVAAAAAGAAWKAEAAEAARAAAAKELDDAEAARQVDPQVLEAAADAGLAGEQSYGEMLRAGSGVSGGKEGGIGGGYDDGRSEGYGDARGEPGRLSYDDGDGRAAQGGTSSLSRPSSNRSAALEGESVRRAGSVMSGGSGGGGADPGDVYGIDRGAYKEPGDDVGSAASTPSQLPVVSPQQAPEGRPQMDGSGAAGEEEESDEEESDEEESDEEESEEESDDDGDGDGEEEEEAHAKQQQQHLEEVDEEVPTTGEADSFLRRSSHGGGPGTARFEEVVESGSGEGEDEPPTLHYQYRDAANGGSPSRLPPIAASRSQPQGQPQPPSPPPLGPQPRHESQQPQPQPARPPDEARPTASMSRAGVPIPPRLKPRYQLSPQRQAPAGSKPDQQQQPPSPPPPPSQQQQPPKQPNKAKESGDGAAGGARRPRLRDVLADSAHDPQSITQHYLKLLHAGILNRPATAPVGSTTAGGSGNSGEGEGASVAISAPGTGRYRPDSGGSEGSHLSAHGLELARLKNKGARDVRPIELSPRPGSRGQVVPADKDGTTAGARLLPPLHAGGQAHPEPPGSSRSSPSPGRRHSHQFKASRQDVPSRVFTPKPTASAAPYAKIYSPGPGAYSPTVFRKGDSCALGGSSFGGGSPPRAWAFGSATQRPAHVCVPFPNESPGPIYLPSKNGLSTLSNIINCKFDRQLPGGRCNLTAGQASNAPIFNPGPGNYEPATTAAGDSLSPGRSGAMPAYSFARTRKLMIPAVDGAALPVLSREHVREYYGTLSPGPAHYSPDTSPTRTAAPAYSVAGRRACWFDPEELSPGPVYKPNDLDRTGRHTLGDRPHAAIGRGPKEYDPNGALSASAWLSMNHARRANYGVHSPGPIYLPNDQPFAHVPSPLLAAGPKDRFTDRFEPGRLQ